jgi:hypothetical protein
VEATRVGVVEGSWVARAHGRVYPDWVGLGILCSRGRECHAGEEIMSRYPWLADATNAVISFALSLVIPVVGSPLITRGVELEWISDDMAFLLRFIVWTMSWFSTFAAALYFNGAFWSYRDAKVSHGTFQTPQNDTSVMKGGSC